MGETNLRMKKNLTPGEVVPGKLLGWDLRFDIGGIEYVDPAFAVVRPQEGAEVHGVAFSIPPDQARGLDQQEGAYNVEPTHFVAYDGREFMVGLYAPKSEAKPENMGKLPSLRYKRLLVNGAREANLDEKYIAEKLEAQPHYVTPHAVRDQTMAWVDAFEADPERSQLRWTAEKLSMHTGKDPAGPESHVSILGFVVKFKSFFSSHNGHTITRRNLIHFRGQSMDVNDIRYGQPGFHPLPDISQCTEEEVEFLWQNLDGVLHRTQGAIVARLQDFLDAQPAGFDVAAQQRSLIAELRSAETEGKL